MNGISNPKSTEDEREKTYSVPGSKHLTFLILATPVPR